MFSWNERPKYFDVWFFCSYRYDVNRLRSTIGQGFRRHNKDSELEVNKKLLLQRTNIHPKKQSAKPFVQTTDTHFELLKLPTLLYFELLSSSLIFVIIVNSSGIELIKRTWFLLTRKDSQTEGSSAS